jgi:uncharacterized membrane protein YgcG
VDWRAPSVVAAEAFLAAALLWYVVMMAVTGRRHRRAMRTAAAMTSLEPADLTPEDLTPEDLAPEELGMLVAGPQRLVEVTLFRLCLEGHVGLFHDSLILVDDAPGEDPARRDVPTEGPARQAVPTEGPARRDVPTEGGPQPTVRQVILTRLRRALPPGAERPHADPSHAQAAPPDAPTGEHGPRGRRRYFGRRRTEIRPSHLNDVLHAGRKRGDHATAQKRLVERGLVHAADAGNIRLRNRAFGAYVAMITVGLVAFAIAVGVQLSTSGVSPEQPPASILLAAGLAVGTVAVVTAATSRFTGGQLHPTTPAGRALVARAELIPATASADALLRFVALRGIRAIPEFERAAHRGEPDADLGPRLKTFTVLAEVFSAVAPFLATSSSQGSGANQSSGTSQSSVANQGSGSSSGGSGSGGRG